MRNKKEYSEEWVDTIRPAILKRDNYRCSVCGVKHRSYVLVNQDGNYSIIDKGEHDEYKKYGAKCYRIFLQVAHLNHDKENNKEENLRAMCPRCHHRYDMNYKSIMRLSDKKKEEVTQSTIHTSS